MEFGDKRPARQTNKRRSTRKSRRKSKVNPDGTTTRVTQKYSRNTTMRTTEILTPDSFEILNQLGEGAYGLV
jgi:hypothetical protein